MADIVIKEEHSYRDARGDIWFQPKRIEAFPDQWRLLSGFGHLMKSLLFTTDGMAISHGAANLVYDLGVDEPAEHPSQEIEEHVIAKPSDQFAGEYEPAFTGTEEQLHTLDSERWLADHTIVPGKQYPYGRFNDLIIDTVKQIQLLSVLKGGEYAGDNDRLANFRRNADGFGTNMELVWAIYAFKHIDAIRQFIEDRQHGVERTRMEGLSSRCDDIIVYMILFKAMLEELNIK